MFNGFSDETFEFFMAIRFNNNRDFFQGNHDWYLRGVREPGLALAEALAPVIEQIDEDLERRPNRALSRINRDIRFSRDKSPYRDYIWVSFHHMGEERHSRPGFYFDIGVDGASCGMGMYDENVGIMSGIRRDLEQNPDILRAALAPVKDDFILSGRPIKRMKVPDSVPDDVRSFYNLKGFYLEREIRDFSLIKSPALADFVADCFRRLAPMYLYMMKNVVPEEE